MTEQSLPQFWVAPMPLSMPEDHPVFRRVAARAWCEHARERGASAEVTAVHEYLEDHIADVTVNDERYVLGIVKLDKFHHVIAWREDQFVARLYPNHASSNDDLPDFDSSDDDSLDDDSLDHDSLDNDSLDNDSSRKEAG